MLRLDSKYMLSNNNARDYSLSNTPSVTRIHRYRYGSRFMQKGLQGDMNSSNVTSLPLEPNDSTRHPTLSTVPSLNCLRGWSAQSPRSDSSVTQMRPVISPGIMAIKACCFIAFAIFTTRHSTYDTQGRCDTSHYSCRFPPTKPTTHRPPSI